MQIKLMYNSKILETTQMSNNEEMIKHSMVCAQDML